MHSGRGLGAHYHSYAIDAVTEAGAGPGDPAIEIQRLSNGEEVAVDTSDVDSGDLEYTP